MSANVDLLKNGYEDFVRGDVEAATAPWSDDFVWEGPNSPDVPGGGVHEGKQSAVQVLQQSVGVWDRFVLSADEFVDGGDTVVVLGHTEVTKGDRSSKGPYVHIWRFRDGTPVRIQLLTDTLQGARTLGIV